MEQKSHQVSFIVVNFRSRNFLSRCLASIQKLSGLSAEIIIVNNDFAPLDPLPAMNFPVKIIQAPENLGFGSGINLGVRSASGQYLFFLNPDAEIISDSIRSALNEFKNNPRLAVLGARLVNESGQIQKWIAGEKITFFQLIKNNLGFNRDEKILRSRRKTIADWVSGGAMMARKNVFQELGGFDEKFFMYFEDVDLCLRVQNANSDVLYFPELVIRHWNGQSFSNPKEQKKYYYRAQDYYFQKHSGRLSALMIKWLRIIFTYHALRD